MHKKSIHHAFYFIKLIFSYHFADHKDKHHHVHFADEENGELEEKRSAEDTRYVTHFIHCLTRTNAIYFFV